MKCPLMNIQCIKNKCAWWNVGEVELMSSGESQGDCSVNVIAIKLKP